VEEMMANDLCELDYRYETFRNTRKKALCRREARLAYILREKFVLNFLGNARTPQKIDSVNGISLTQISSERMRREKFFINFH